MNTGLDELDDEQRALAARLRTTLRDSERVDARTMSRLAQARAEVIASASSGGGRFAPRSPWLWATGSAAALVLASLLVLRPSPFREPAEPSAADALEMMTDELDNDFYEDLEMYRWLEQDGNV